MKKLKPTPPSEPNETLKIEDQPSVSVSEVDLNYDDMKSIENTLEKLQSESKSPNKKKAKIRFVSIT